MNDHMITTVIPTYRRPVMLESSIYSSLNQTWPHLKVCIFDNASGDETEEVVAEIAAKDSRVSYHRHSVGITAYENFNYGVRAVETPFFSLLSDDDVLLPNFYERSIEAFNRYPDAMFVAMTILEVENSGCVMEGAGASPPAVARYYHAGEAYDGMWAGTVPAIWTGFVFRRQVFDEIGLINESAGPAADVAFIRHLFARYPGVVLPGIGALIRSHQGSFSVKKDTSLIKMNRAYWKGQAEDIENDKQVSELIRFKVYSLIEKMYVRGLKRNILSNLIDGRVDAAFENIEILRSLGYSISSMLLKVFAFFAGYVPLCSLLYKKICLVRRNKLKAQNLIVKINHDLSSEQYRALLHYSNGG